MRGYKICEINVLRRIENTRNPKGFSKRTGIGKRLRELAIAGELHNPELVELVWAVVGLIVVETGFRGSDHVVHIESVLRGVINLDVHTLVVLPLYCIAAGNIGKEVENLHLAHIVGVVVTSILMPVTLQISRCKRNLVIRGADDGSVIDPIRVGSKEIGDAPP